MVAIKSVNSLIPGTSSSSSVAAVKTHCYAAMNDDFNTPILISHLFEGVRIINSVKDKKESITAEDLELLKQTMNQFVFDVLGLKAEGGSENAALIDGLMNTILNIRAQARINKDWPTSDLIRDNLSDLKIQVKDTKEGSEWSVD